MTTNLCVHFHIWYECQQCCRSGFGRIRIILPDPPIGLLKKHGSRPKKTVVDGYLFLLEILNVQVKLGFLSVDCFPDPN